jgi:hypothetical protein
VYADRPRICQSYRCELLRSFERGDISEDVAREIIGKTVAAKNETKSLANEKAVGDLEAVGVLIQKWLEEPSFGTAYNDLFFRFMILQRYLDRFFRKKPRYPSISATAP